MFFREGTLLNPSRSSPWSWFWWCSLHWRLCWCCPSCRYPQDDHCGWRVSRVNGKYTKSRPGTIARINLFREQVLNCKVGYFDYIYIYIDDSLDVGSPTRLGRFCLTRPGFTTHVDVLPGGSFTWGKTLEGAVWYSWPRCFHFYHCFGDISLGSDPLGCDENRFEGCEDPKIWDISYI